MKIKLIVIGETESQYLNQGFQLYIQRLTHYIGFEKIVITIPKKFKTLHPDELKLQEGELILKALYPGDILVLLDEKGKEFTSPTYATYLQQKMNSGCKTLVFVIGGAFGFSEKVYGMANDKIALSKMTFTHDMVRLIFVEQLYRAFTILRNEPYHH